jgi:hypothetical protein
MNKYNINKLIKYTPFEGFISNPDMSSFKGETTMNWKEREKIIRHFNREVKKNYENLPQDSRYQARIRTRIPTTGTSALPLNPAWRVLPSFWGYTVVQMIEAL